MNALVRHISRPVRGAVSAVLNPLPFSGAELLITLAVLAGLWMLAGGIRCAVRRQWLAGRPAAGDPGSCRGVDLGGGLPALGGGVLRRQLAETEGIQVEAGFGGTAGGHRRVVCPAGKRHRLRGAPGRKRGLFDDGGGDF